MQQCGPAMKGSRALKNANRFRNSVIRLFLRSGMASSHHDVSEKELDLGLSILEFRSIIVVLNIHIAVLNKRS